MCNKYNKSHKIRDAGVKMHTVGVTASKELEGMVVFQHIGIKKPKFFGLRWKEREERGKMVY